jgi:hypothetical protein
MLNLVQHLTKLRNYETLKQVQGDKSGMFARPSLLSASKSFSEHARIIGACGIKGSARIVAKDAILRN